MEQQEAGTTEVMGLDDKSRKTLSDWIGDMVALEGHIEAALDRQLAQVKDDAVALKAVQGFHGLVKRQRDAVKVLQEQYGPTSGSPLKQAGSAFLGMAAGIIDMIRTEGNSKALRDDATAFNLAATGYGMLYTTATAFGDRPTADLAEAHLRGYAGAIREINRVLWDVVVSELAKDGHKVQPGAADRTRRVVDAAWQQTDQATSGVSG